MKPLLMLLAAPLIAATIYTPGTYEWTATFQDGVTAGLIVWDNSTYTVATTTPTSRYGFGGAISDATYPHRLTIVFTAPPESVTITRLSSLVPVGLGYLPYGHLYGGEWPHDIPRFLGCDEPWYAAQHAAWVAENCHGCGPVAPTGESVPEPGSWVLLGAGLIGLALMRRRA